MKNVTRFAVLFALLLALVVSANSVQAQDHSAAVAFGHSARIGYDHCCYTVYYRCCCSEPWQHYGCFDCPCEANRAARSLRYQGYEVFVR